MKTIEDLLKNLARPEVLEFGLVTNRLPSVNIGGKFEPVDDEAPSTERLLQMLVKMGGSRHVEALSEKPVQWTTRLDGVGVIAVAAIMRKDVVQARFTVARRDPAAARPMRETQQGPPAQRPPEKPAQAAQGNRPAGAFVRTQQGTGASAPPPAPTPQPSPQPAPVARAAPAAQPSPQAAPAKTSVPREPVAAPAQRPPQASQAPAQRASVPAGPAVKPVSSGVLQAAVPARPSQAPAPPPEEWDDDDEPTVQTLSPQVVAPPAPPSEPKPKPARKPDEVPPPIARPPTPAEPVRSPEPPEVRPPEASRPEVVPIAARKEPPPIAVEGPQTIPHGTRSSSSQASAQPAQPKPEMRPRPAEGARRINTPTSVDAVDVEITTNDPGSRAAKDVERAAKAEESPPSSRPGAHSPPPVTQVQSNPPPQSQPQIAAAPPAPVPVSQAPNTQLQIQPPAAQREPAPRMVTGVMPSAIPSTAPSAAIPEKERPRIDGSAALEAFLAMAIAARASDLHVIAGRPVLLRVATDLLPRTQPVPPEHVERIAREIVPARLREMLEANGSCDFTVENAQYGRFRVNVSRQRTGWKLSLRVIPREPPSLFALGLPDGLAALLKHSQGLVLITGPIAHGKTTTLSALVDQINRETASHVITIEDPLELVHPRKRALVSQREIGSHAKSFAAAIDAAMREDADVLVIGELRDAETVRLAIAASEAGHLVLATMNSPSAAKTIDRLVESYPGSEQTQARAAVAGSLRAVIGQRLVPSADRTRLHCAVEVLPSSIALYTLIRDGRTHQIPALQQRGGKGFGFVRLDESLAELVRSQKVTIEVAKAFAESPADLEAQAQKPAAAAQPRKG